MKVAIIPSWYNSPRAPSRGSFIRVQAEGLSARGHEVSLVVLDRDSDGKLFDIERTLENGLHCTRISVPAPMHRLFGFYMPKVLSKIVRTEILKIKPEVVHAHAARPAGVVAQYALTNLDIPYILTEHSGPLKAFWWTAHGKRQIARSYQKSKRLFAVSEFLKKEMLQQFGNAAATAKVLHNGINTALFSCKGEPPDEGKFLFIGGLEPKKGLEILLTAFARLSSEVKWSLTVVGQGPLLDRLRKIASHLKISDRIFWVGPVEHEYMANIYAEHDFIVVPSIHETFSLVCAEALACGRPVIATRCGGPEEVIPQGGGILVPVGDVTALSCALLDALSGEIEFDAQKNIDYVVSTFSLDRLINELENVYANLIESGD